MSKSSRRTRRRSTDKAAVTQAPEIARAILAVRTPTGTPLRGIDFGLERTEAGYHLGQWLESVLTDFIPPNSPDGLLLLLADTDHPHGLISGLVELDEIIEEIESRLPAALTSSEWQVYLDARANDGRWMRIEGCSFSRDQVLRCVLAALRASQSPLDCTTFQDDTLRKLCYDRLAKLDHLSLARAIEKEFATIVSEEQEDQPTTPPIEPSPLRRAIQEGLARATVDLESATRELSSVQHEFRTMMAEHLTPIVNRFIATHRQGTVEEKRELANAINRSLKELGLALRCPRTGLPSLLTTVDRANENAESRYFYDARVPDSGRKRRTFSTMRLETVDLMPDRPRREGFTIWRDRIQQEREGAGENPKKSI